MFEATKAKGAARNYAPHAVGQAVRVETPLGQVICYGRVARIGRSQVLEVEAMSLAEWETLAARQTMGTGRGRPG